MNCQIDKLFKPLTAVLILLISGCSHPQPKAASNECHFDEELMEKSEANANYLDQLRAKVLSGESKCSDKVSKAECFINQIERPSVTSNNYLVFYMSNLIETLNSNPKTKLGTYKGDILFLNSSLNEISYRGLNGNLLNHLDRRNCSSEFVDDVSKIYENGTLKVAAKTRDTFLEMINHQLDTVPASAPTKIQELQLLKARTLLLFR